LWNDTLKEDEMSGACSMYWGRNAYRILVGNLKEDHFVDLVVDWKIILKRILQKQNRSD
jgi:hypothetical protein